MIHEITSSLPTFKTVQFRPGFNLLLVEKSTGAKKEQTRNAAGKSSLVEIIHFLLGGKVKPDGIFAKPELQEHTFLIKLDLLGQTSTFERGFMPEKYKNHTYIQSNLGRLAAWNPKTDDAGDLYFSLAVWCQLLGSAFFGLGEPESGGPSFRSLFSYFCRRSKDGGFFRPDYQSNIQQAADSQVNVAYLLGLDWRIPMQLEALRKRRVELDRLKQELKGSGIVGELIGTASHLQAELAVSRNRADQLQTQLDNFRVLPEFEEIEKEASGLAIRIAQLANQNTLDRRLIKDVQESIQQEVSPEITTVAELYEAAGIQLPGITLRSLEDTRRFHQAVISNRRSHLQHEIEQADGRIKSRQHESGELEARQQELMKLLQSHGALDQYNALQNEYQRLRSNAQSIEQRLRIARRIETGGADLAVEKAEMDRRLILDLAERAPIIEEITVFFGELSRRLSEKRSLLEIAHDDHGLKFNFSGGPNRSEGIRGSEVFCFDVTLAVIAARHGRSPGFLFHDSHLFDPMEERQIATALEIGAEMSEKHKFQYIVSLNSDRLPTKEFKSSFEIKKYQIEPVLDDSTETGGLFGMRFV